MDDREAERRRRGQSYREMLEAIRYRALVFLQVAPAMEGRREIEMIARSPAISACEPDICSIELMTRNDLIIVRCHTCKRGGSWRDLRHQQDGSPRKR